MGYAEAVRRALALLLLIAAIAPVTWLRMPLVRASRDYSVRFEKVEIPAKELSRPHLGPFELVGIWQMSSSHRGFGGFSSLAPVGDGRLLSMSDRGFYIFFAPPGRPMTPIQYDMVFSRLAKPKANRDIEAIAWDAESKTAWTAQENYNAVARLHWRDGRFHLSGFCAPPVMALWGSNSGPESMTRLADGRFVTISEGFPQNGTDRYHEAAIFASDPVDNPEGERFFVEGIPGFKPTDIAQLPDGRALVLFRRPVWPFPVRFAGRLAIGDPSAIAKGKTWRLREVARLSSVLPVDNFEGLAIEPREDGKVDVWLISDDNMSAFQRTLLWHLVVDPADLPGESGR